MSAPATTTGPEEPTEHRTRVGEVELAWFEWRPELRGRGPTLLLAHATGFHARCWDPVIRRLPPGHVIAVDQRGHGRSQKTRITHWGVFGEDLAGLVWVEGLRDLVGVGHSMGGHAMVEAAAACPERFRSLVLIDPVIPSPDSFGAGWSIASLGDQPHPTSKRKRDFASPREMIERFEDREPYSIFESEALHAYCTHGLLPSEAGGFRLACPPEIEASIYMASRSNPGVYDAIRALELPVLVLRAKLPPAERDVMDFSSSPTWPGLVSEFRDGREIHFPEHTHFLPMELPERVAELILAETAAIPHPRDR